MERYSSSDEVQKVLQTIQLRQVQIRREAVPRDVAEEELLAVLREQLMAIQQLAVGVPTVDCESSGSLT